MQDSIETAEDVSLLISPPEQSILTSIDILPTIDSPNVNNVHGEKPRASQKNVLLIQNTIPQSLTHRQKKAVVSVEMKKL